MMQLSSLVAKRLDGKFHQDRRMFLPQVSFEHGLHQGFSDLDGNMTRGLGGKLMAYDAENRPLSVTHNGTRTCYVYGADGKRLKKVDGLAANQNCAALSALALVTVYFGPVEIRNYGIAGQEEVITCPHPAIRLTNGTTPAQASYLHTDHLGSVRAITDAAGVKQESAIYKPFGEQTEWRAATNSGPDDKGWIGERYDADAGLQYLNARYYDPDLGMFIQPDWFEVMLQGGRHESVCLCVYRPSENLLMLQRRR
jgi:RHS repeat-associated protein